MSACASSGQTLEVSGPGPDWAGPASFSLDFARPENRAAGYERDSSLPQIATRRLVERGMAPAPAASGRYLVELGYSVRPMTVGAYVATAQAGSTWLDAPARPGWRKPDEVCTLTLRFTETSSDKEVFRARAADRGGKAGCESLAPRLLDVALAALPPRPAP